MEFFDVKNVSLCYTLITFGWIYTGRCGIKQEKKILYFIQQKCQLANVVMKFIIEKGEEAFQSKALPRNSYHLLLV